MLTVPKSFHSRLGIVSTFPPTRCGIGKFSCSLISSLNRVAPWLETQVVRLIEHPSEPPAGEPVVMEIDPNSPVSIKAAARCLNQCDAVSIQHEFGIFGGDAGEPVIDLLDHLEVPAVVTLHTVVPDPTTHQRWIIEQLAERARLVTLAETARDVLIDTYGVAPNRIGMIRHGSLWRSSPTNPAPRKNLITWGLLGPGKGIERAIRSVGTLIRKGVPVHYRVVGRTHPAVARREGFAYRHSLEKLVSELNLDDAVEFVDRYLEEDELEDMVRESDVVVVPYDNHDQACSGVVTEALGKGRPVVATRFPYAVEMLATGAGIVVDHDSGAMADAIGALLTDPDVYDVAAAAAAEWSDILQWETVAGHYARTFERLTSRLASA